MEPSIPKGAYPGLITEAARQARQWTGAGGQVEFSALITCYYEERSIEEFHRRLSDTLEATGRSYEIIFVNDGSRDRTWEKLKEIFAADPHVYAVLDLFKNAGQQAAVTAASVEARGSACVLMDSDLQLLPEELPLLIKQYDAGYDLVTGYRLNRKDSLFRIIPSRLANMIMRRASRSSIRDFGCTFKVYNADLLRAFDYGPRHIFSNVELISRIDRMIEVPVTHFPRKYGKSGWTFAKLMKYNVDNVVILSERPFQFTALFCILFAAAFLLRLIITKAFSFTILPSVSNGLLLNALLIAFLVIVATLSFIGELTTRVFTVTRGAPRYIVREVLRKQS